MPFHFYVGITDDDWYTYLSSQPSLDEVNFWQPSGGRHFRALEPGEPFLFKLHSPQNFIVGGGFFSHFTTLPVSYAWSAFATKNGALTESEMRKRLERYRRISSNTGEDYQIGCILLQAPFFFQRDEWIPASDWPPSIQQGRRYSTDELRAQVIWEQVEVRLKGEVSVGSVHLPQGYRDPKYGDPRLVPTRLGQGTFRVLVTDAYNRKCAFTGSPVLHVLEAAHIKPFGRDGPNDVRNGVLFRQDIHTLFDRGYITVTPEHRVEVSPRIKAEFANGHEYYSEHGKLISVPGEKSNQPSSEFLTWHNENVYLG